MKILKVLSLSIIALAIIGCGKTLAPIIVTGPAGITANNDAYKTIRFKNAGSAYWRFWLGNGQQIVLYPGTQIFLKPTNDFWNKCQGLWIHAYLEVKNDGRVKEATFAGEQWIQICTTGRTWVCETGQVIGADIFIGDAPGSRYPVPTHFSYSFPFIPASLQGLIQ